MPSTASLATSTWGGAVVASVIAAGLTLAGMRPATGESEMLRAGLERVEREAWAMGTRVRLVAEASDRGAAQLATEAALREIERVERLLGTWDPGTELSQLNASPVGHPIAVSAELSEVLGAALVWAERTGRAFDPSVGPLVDAWGLRERARVPSAAELAVAVAATGPGAFVVSERHAVRGFDRAWIDSGGFGKGAALRSLAEMMVAEISASARGQREHDRLERMLVDLGGQLWAAAPPGAPWRVDVAHPGERTRPVARLAVRDVSVATSGASERPGHLLDPRSGRPVRDWGSVTVVSADALEADVLSTALYVMGPEEGLAWARAHAVAALLIEVTPEGTRSTWTEAMDAWLVDVPAEADRPGERE